MSNSNQVVVSVLFWIGVGIVGVVLINVFPAVAPYLSPLVPYLLLGAVSSFFIQRDVKYRQQLRGEHPSGASGNYYYVKAEWVRDGKLRPVTVQIPMAEMQRLFAMSYDRERAERLVFLAVQQNPGRTGRWYVQKAIWDLERDRH